MKDLLRKPPLWLLSLAAVACGGGRDGVIERVATQLVAGEYRVVAENDKRPVDVGFLAPSTAGIAANPLPSLRMAAPAEVTIDLPVLPAGALVRFSVGVSEESYDTATGLVRFRAQAGAATFEESVRIAPETPRPDRRWMTGELAAPSRGSLVLSTAFEGASSAPVVAGFALLEVVVPHAVRRSKASRSAPNVVLIVVDTLRADAIHAMGGAKETTPALDALAARGTSFERAYAPSSWTVPSTASLLTGLNPLEHGVVGPDSIYLAARLRTLGESFAEAGLRTAGFSTNPLITGSKNFDQGFEEFRTDAWGSGEDTVDRALAWLDSLGDDRFFLYLHLTDPHSPYTPPADLVERWAPDVPADWPQARTWTEFLKALGKPPYDRDRLLEFVAHSRALYDCEVAATDRALARLFERLGDDTLVALSSDHGEEFFEHGTYGHSKQLFEETIRVPLLLAGPGVPAGVRRADPVENRFLAATLLALAGVEPAGFSPGVDLIGDAPRAPDDPLFFSTNVGQWVDLDTRRYFMRQGELYAVMIGSRRLIYARREKERPVGLSALFDLEADPRERDDIGPLFADDVARMTARIESWVRDSEAASPKAFEGDEATLELLHEIGYVGD